MTTYSTTENFQQAITQFDSKTKLYRLVEDYHFEWGQPWMRKALFVPAGFEYDKASVPRFLWGIARPDGPWDTASLLHDRLYLFRGKLPAGEFKTFVDGRWCNDPSPWTRPQSDDLLEYVGTLGGASKQEAALYKWMVELFPPNWFKF